MCRGMSHRSKGWLHMQAVRVARQRGASELQSVTCGVEGTSKQRLLLAISACHAHIGCHACNACTTEACGLLGDGRA
jgi:hypothetical protein